MRGTGDQMLDKVIFVYAHSFNTTTTTILRLEFVNRQPLDVAIMSQRDDDIFFFDQILVFNIGNIADLQLSPTWIAKLALNL